jgi:hypothetical protein
MKIAWKLAQVMVLGVSRPIQFDPIWRGLFTLYPAEGV